MKILIADDHLLFREGLKLVLQKFEPGIHIVEADTYDDAAEVIRGGELLDIVLLDLKMPGMNGFSGLEDMCRRVGPVPVVIISGAYTQGDIGTAFEHGAAGFVPKTLSSRAMYSAINLVLSGERYVPSLAFIKEDSPPEATRTEPESAASDDPFARLTPREHDVLALLVEGLSNREIAERLSLREVSIRVRLTGIFKKLGVTSRTQAVGLAIRGGFPN